MKVKCLKVPSLKSSVLSEIGILQKQISMVNPVCQTTGSQFCWNKKSANTNWTWAQLQIFIFWPKVDKRKKTIECPTS